MTHQEHTEAGEVENAAWQGGESIEAEIQVGETPEVPKVWWQACQGAMLIGTKLIPSMATWVEGSGRRGQYATRRAHQPHVRLSTEIHKIGSYW